MERKLAYWIELSEYDLDTAKSMLDTGRYLYVGFMCHQAIEKMLKACWQFKKNEIPPRTHNLSYLASKTELLDQFSKEQQDFIDELEPLNIETRYPEYKEALMKKLNRTYTETIYNGTRGLHHWIKEKLS